MQKNRLAQRVSLFCGIAGAASRQTIEKKRKLLPVVPAADNDAAGGQCRACSKDSESVIPKVKERNDGLTSILKNA